MAKENDSTSENKVLESSSKAGEDQAAEQFFFDSSNQNSKSPRSNNDAQKEGTGADSAKDNSNVSSLGFSNIEITDNAASKSDRTTQTRADEPQKHVVIPKIENALKEFADNDPTIKSANVRDLQNQVKEFLANPDKDKAWKEFAPECSKTKVSMGKDGIDTLKQADEEAARAPGRAELDKNYRDQLDKFFKQTEQLPLADREKAMGALQWQDGETKEMRAERVRQELSKNPELLTQFNKMEDAQTQRDASMSPREQALRKRHMEQIQEQKLIYTVARQIEILRDFHLL